MNVKQQLNTPAMPDLPNPQDRYERLTVAQTNAALRTFCLKVVNAFTSLLGPRGGKFINMPYAAVQRDTSFNFTAANTATLITCTTVDFTNGTSLDTSDGIHVSQDGIYNYQFSIQMANTDSQSHNSVVWLRVNGTDVAGTSSKFDVPSKHGSSDGYLVAACNFYVSLSVDDHIELWGAVSQAETAVTDGIYYESYAPQTSPYASPSIPSVVTTLTFVSNLQS